MRARGLSRGATTGLFALIPDRRSTLPFQILSRGDGSFQCDARVGPEGAIGVVELAGGLSEGKDDLVARCV